jgi:TolB protein
VLRTEQLRSSWIPVITSAAADLIGVIGVLALLTPFIGASAEAQSLGLLQGHVDVGKVLHVGDTVYDPKNGTYTVTGSGSNLWFTADEMQFAWKRMHGDVALTAEIEFVGEKGNNHRKAALMVRQSLDPGSPYVDVARHGDGLTSLQFRLSPGDVTREVETAVSAPRWVRIEKRGEFAYVSVGDSREALRFAGASMRLPLSGDFYVGIAVCSHDKDVTETAIFRHLEIQQLSDSAHAGQLWSTLETVKVASTDRRVAYTAAERFAAPNWSHNGTAIVFAHGGTLQRFGLDPAPYPSLNVQAVMTARPTPLRTDAPAPLSDHHGFSPDGTELAVSATDGGVSHVYVLAADDSSIHKVATGSSAVWNSWSPDGRTLALSEQRGGESKICTLPAQGGAETCPPHQQGRNENADFSTDGEWIYFGSDRTGAMQLWRMHPDGSAQEQLLTESGDDLSPHPSPDGKWLVYIAFPNGAPAHAEQVAELRLLSLSDRKSHLLATLLAGPGTILSPSWSPDSTRVAFVSYANVP